MSPRLRRGPDLGITLLAACGDAVLILLFAVIGRASHGEHDASRAIPALMTAGPFLAGWFASAPLLGAYSHRALRDSSSGVQATARAWLGGCLIGLLLRSAGERRLVPLTFALVALLFNLATLSTWRWALARVAGRHL
ncbi:MAG TPA: DUF3054 domain-containing protein [Chloroflexota bacterium]|nr:DUF3054 domain-containing protein [Chloroflexota bacterium]